MHVGFGSFFQAIDGCSDRETWTAELALADRAEALGFESVWAVEHHFDGYSMSPNPLQYLSWVAARTKHVQLGSMVCVLPWHDPVRLAEDASVLDHVSGGRLVLGIGRGLARDEFDGLDVDMARSRELFGAHAETLLNAFDTGTLVTGGRRAQIRPRPFRSLRGRTYASSISPESTATMARLGVGMMLFLQKPWPQTIADVERYARGYAELNGEQAPRPLLVLLVACDRDPGRARDRFAYIERYYASTIEHYEFDDAALARIPGYEYYGRIAETIRQHGKDGFARFLAELQPCGTPAQVAEQVVDCARGIDAGGVILVPSFGGMPAAAAAETQAVLAEEVLPMIRAVDKPASVQLV